jgi:hypothetical protein
MKKKTIILSLILILFAGCSVFKTIANISYVKFRLKDIANFKVLGIEISNKTSLKDLNFSEIARLTSAVTGDKLPVSFTVNIEAKNSNKDAYEATDVQITSFPFTLYYDNKELLSGDVDKPITIPGKNQTVVFPVRISFDILKAFNNLSLDEIAAIIFELGGKNKNLKAVKIKAEPQIMLPGGFTYKQAVTISSDQFR